MSRLLIPSYIIFILIFSNCSVYRESEEPIEDIIEAAWEIFQTNNYSRALNLFSELIYKAENDENGYHGSGWCYLLLNDADEAAENFRDAINKGNTTLDPKAGLAIAYHASGNYSQSITYGKSVLDQQDDYYFEYQPLINYQDLRIVLAMSYYHEGQLTKSQQQVDLLATEIGNYVYNPLDYPLDINDEDSWTVNGIDYSSYAEALMAVIDLLDQEFGM